MGRIVRIKDKISNGASLEDLQREYPITKALFTRLGGVIQRPVSINHDVLKLIIENNVISNQFCELDKDVIIGTLLGDGNIYKTLNTPTFSFAHSFSQIGYVKLKYELLKPYVNRLYLADKTDTKDYSIHVTLKTCEIFHSLFDIFYTGLREGKSNRKNILTDSVLELITPKSFAFWVMDDGKKYGSGRYMFSLSIGKQPYYDYKKFVRFVDGLSEKFRVKFRAREEKISYEITPVANQAMLVFNMMADYLWPDFSYKFGVESSACGLLYKAMPWYDSWLVRKKLVCRPV